MLMNNLDPDVAERPDDLIVYGGSGRAARSWEAFDAIVATLRRLEHDETLLIQSGKPVAVFRTHPWAPRVIIANALLVPAWATWDVFRDLEDRGLTMYGQMTAGSWIYIGTQGILQGTYETLAELARRHFGGTLSGRLVVTAGLGGMGGAQPLAVTMNEGIALVDRSRSRRASSAGWRRATWTSASASLDEALTRIDAAAARAGQARSIALEANAADVLPELVRRGVVPDVVTDQTSAHDALNGYVPERDVAGRGGRAARRPIRPSTSAGRWRRWRRTCARCSTLQARGAIAFDYGNNIRAQAEKAGVTDAFRIPGFVPEYIRPLFCRGKGPFRWAALSGDPGRHRRDRSARARDVRRRRAAVPLDPAGRRARRVPGAAGAHLLARLRRARALRPGDQRPGPPRRRRGADRHRPRSSRRRIGRVAQPRNRRHARRQRRHRRLAGPQRAAQHLVRRHVGVGPPRRRRRHRLLAARRHGDRRRRHARGGRETATRPDLRSRQRRRPSRRRRAIPTRSPLRERAESTCRCWGTGR